MRPSGTIAAMTDPEIPPGYEVCDMPDGEFAALIGPIYMLQTDAGARFAFRAAPKHTNARAVVHGGMLMSFMDQVLGLSVQRAVGNVDVATVSLNCDFVASVRPGDLVEGEAVVTRVTKQLVFVRGTLCCGSKVIMTASGLWTRIRPSSPGPHPLPRNSG
jgi:uncharacterized protein (TIGR00369 family)